MIWRCTMFINGSVDGWSESLYHLDSGNRAPAVAGAFESIISKRVRFLGAPYRVVAYRITAYSTNIGGRPSGRLKYFVRKLFPTPINSFGAEPGNVGCEIGMVDQTLAVSTRLTFGAPPDDCVNTGGEVNRAIVPAGAPASFGTMVDDYVAALASNVAPAPNWGWAAVGVPQDRDVGGFTWDTTGRLVIAPMAPFVAPIVSGVTYPARIRGVNGRKSSLNGPLNVTVSDTGALVSTVAIGQVLSHVGGSVKVYPPVRNYTQYGDGTLALQSVKHVRGRPFGISRGRAPVRPRA